MSTFGTRLPSFLTCCLYCRGETCKLFATFPKRILIVKLTETVRVWFKFSRSFFRDLFCSSKSKVFFELEKDFLSYFTLASFIIRIFGEITVHLSQMFFTIAFCAIHMVKTPILSRLLFHNKGVIRQILSGFNLILPPKPEETFPVSGIIP